MRKIFFILLISVLSITGGSGQNRSITFREQPFKELQALAKSQNKLIFIDAYATWCGPCKWMSANMFTNDSIADYYNKTFICSKYDMEKGEGLELRSRYEVKAYPTLLFIDANGNMVHKRVGAPQKVQEYLEMGQTALTPGQGLAAVAKKYDAGNPDPQLLMLYLKRLQEAYMPVTEPLAKYFTTQKDENLISSANWKIIYSYTDDMKSREFRYLVKNQDNFTKLYTKDSVEGKISQVFLRTLITLTRNPNFSEENYSTTKQAVRASGFSGAEKVIFTADINMYLSRNQADKFLEAVYTGTDKYYKDDPQMLNSMAWQIFSMTDDEKYTRKALDWAKRSVDLKGEAANTDTYAQLLFKLGRKDEALKNELKAIELAKNAGLETKEYDQALAKMQGSE